MFKMTLTILSILLVSFSHANILGVDPAQDLGSEYLSEKECKNEEESFFKKNQKSMLDSIFKRVPTDELRTDIFVQRFKDSNGKDLKPLSAKKLLKVARCKSYLDDVEYNILRTYVRATEPKSTIKLPELDLLDYVIKKKEVNSRFLFKKMNKTSHVFPLKKFPMKLEGKRLTMRERLYTLYTPEQMKEMGEVIRFILDIVHAEKVETIVRFSKKAGREAWSIHHTPSDIYRLALRVFKQEQKRMMNSYPVMLPFSNIDFIAAAYELNYIPGPVVSILTSDENFYKKEMSFLKKMRNYLVSLGLTAAEFHPATAPYVLLGVIIYNTYHEMNKEEDRIEYENFFFE